MNTMLSFNVDHWTWLTDHEQLLTNHESHDLEMDLDAVLDIITTILEEDDER